MSEQQRTRGAEEEPKAPRGIRPVVVETARRLRYAPLALLIAAAVASSITGASVRDEQRARQTTPPTPVAAASEALPEACGPAPVAPAADGPWSPANREASDAIWGQNLGFAQTTIVEGRDGWVFWGDYQIDNFSQGLGRRVLSQFEMDRWVAQYGPWVDSLRSQGIDVVIQVVPSKGSIYPERLPEWAEGLRGPTTLDYLRYTRPDLPVMDLRPALTAAKERGPVYASLNSHWTPYGGTVGWSALAECLRAVDPKYADLAPLPVAGIEPHTIVSEFEPFGHPTPAGLADSAKPVWGEAPKPMTLTDSTGAVRQVSSDYATDLTELPAVTRTEESQSETSALIFRDSQGSSIASGWQAGFRSTVQVANAADKPETLDVQGYVDRYHPDVVVFEMTERYLGYVPQRPPQGG